MKLEGTETAGLTLLTVVVRFVAVLRARAVADKSVALKTTRKMLTRKNGKPARTRALMEEEFFFMVELLKF